MNVLLKIKFLTSFFTQVFTVRSTLIRKDYIISSAILGALIFFLNFVFMTLMNWSKIHSSIALFSFSVCGLLLVNIVLHLYYFRLVDRRLKSITRVHSVWVRLLEVLLFFPYLGLILFIASIAFEPKEAGQYEYRVSFWRSFGNWLLVVGVYIAIGFGTIILGMASSGKDLLEIKIPSFLAYNLPVFGRYFAESADIFKTIEKINNDMLTTLPKALASKDYDQHYNSTMNMIEDIYQKDGLSATGVVLSVALDAHWVFKLKDLSPKGCGGALRSVQALTEHNTRLLEMSEKRLGAFKMIPPFGLQHFFGSPELLFLAYADEAVIYKFQDVAFDKIRDILSRVQDDKKCADNKDWIVDVKKSFDRVYDKSTYGLLNFFMKSKKSKAN